MLVHAWLDNHVLSYWSTRWWRSSIRLELRLLLLLQLLLLLRHSPSPSAAGVAWGGLHRLQLQITITIYCLRHLHDAVCNNYSASELAKCRRPMCRFICTAECMSQACFTHASSQSHVKQTHAPECLSGVNQYARLTMLKLDPSAEFFLQNSAGF